MVSSRTWTLQYNRYAVIPTGRHHASTTHYRKPPESTTTTSPGYCPLPEARRLNISAPSPGYSGRKRSRCFSVPIIVSSRLIKPNCTDGGSG